MNSVPFRRALRWLLESGIQRVDVDPALDGGVAAWYDEASRSHPFLYSEIAGFAISTFCALGGRLGDESLLERGVRAGRWLLGAMDAGEGRFRCLLPLVATRFDAKKDLAYSFDTGVLLNAFANLHRATGDPAWLGAAARSARWLAGECLLPSGELRPAFDLASGRFVEEGGEWSLVPGSHHAKVAAALLNLFDLTGERPYAEAAGRIADAALRFQRRDGRFESFVSGGETNLHPHFYSVEGLLVSGVALGRGDCVGAALRGIEWAFSLQGEEGLLPRFFRGGEGTGASRADVLAQALRAVGFAKEHGLLPREAYSRETGRLLDALLSFQVESPDARSDGGFYFGSLSSGEALPHVSSWTTLFALQGLALLEDRGDGNGTGLPLFSI